MKKLHQNKKILLLVVGNPLLLKTWSGTARSIYDALVTLGCHVCTIDTSVSKYSLVRVVWAVSRILLGKSPRGFQYSLFYYKWYFETKLKNLPEIDIVLSLNTHLPHPRFKVPFDAPLIIYDDSSIKQLVDVPSYYWKSINNNDKWIFDNERTNLSRARHVYGMSRLATHYFRKELEISEAQYVYGGANLNLSMIRHWFKEEWSQIKLNRIGELKNKNIKFVLIATDPVYKGINQLIDVAALLNKLQWKTEIHLIGSSHNSTDVISHGRIDKSTDLRQFFSIVTSCHFGWLYPSFEALGITPIECHALRVPMVCLNEFGPKGTLLEQIDISVDAENSIQEITHRINNCINNDYEHRVEMLSSMQLYNWSWERSLHKILSKF